LVALDIWLYVISFTARDAQCLVCVGNLRRSF
jgi:hypothetical protein